jgi:hypothetical protein
MPKPGLSVVPIRRHLLASDADREVADLAYLLWLARCFRSGSPESDRSPAARKVEDKTSAGLFLVARRNPITSLG